MTSERSRTSADHSDIIVTLEHDLIEAQRARDESRLQRLVGDDFTMTAGVPGREVRSRSDWIDIALHRYEITEFEFEELVVQCYGSCAVARSRFRQRATLDGSRRNTAYRITDVWVFDEPLGWRVQARHTQRVEGD